ncbi:hypothetical protein [Clostridium hydrogeniformans]|uniref:hypothetical protein n=1 Tax=Clostridium hydrogeniformans TaxID=349933 RepID=UPI00047F4497|nr:hypothetical protein [Clostridium hydrogeniformans]
MLDSKNNFYTTFENEVTGKDVTGNDYVILRMLCTVTINGIQYTFDIVNQELYKLNKTFCKKKVSEFKEYCEEKAEAMGVDIL